MEVSFAFYSYTFREPNTKELFLKIECGKDRLNLLVPCWYIFDESREVVESGFEQFCLEIEDYRSEKMDSFSNLISGLNCLINDCACNVQCEMYLRDTYKELNKAVEIVWLGFSALSGDGELSVLP